MKFKIGVILTFSLLIVIILAFIFYDDTVRKHVSDVHEFVFGIFLLGSLILIVQLRGIRDDHICPNRKRDDCKPIHRVLSFPTFVIIGISLAILSFYLSDITITNMIITMMLSVVIQVAVTCIHIGMTISRCSPCIYCRGKWSHDQSCRYHISSTN